MLEEGAIDGVDAIFALHVAPTLESGVIGSRSGVVMAASGRFTITVGGRGGHAAQPHLTVDPILAAAAIVTRFNAPCTQWKRRGS